MVFLLGFFIFLLPVSVQNFAHASPVTWNPGMLCAPVAIENSSKVNIPSGTDVLF